MIGSSRHREALQTLQGETATLQAQVMALSRELAALGLQLATQQKELADAQARIAQLEKAGNVHGAALERHAATLETRAGDVAALQETGERHDEDLKQLRGHLARLERQAAIDLDEMRQTNSAIASSVLLRPTTLP